MSTIEPRKTLSRRGKRWIGIAPLVGRVRNESSLPLVVQFKWLTAAVTGVALMVSGCESSGHGYPEKVSRLLPADSRLYWLDNDRVFVPGYAPDDKLLDGEGKPKKGLYILDTRNNSYVRHADLGHYSRFCFNEGFVTYTVSGKMRDTVETNRHMEGTFGEEKLLPLGAKQNASLGNKFTYTECPKVDREKRLRPEHVALEQAHLLVAAMFLRPEDGYLFIHNCKELYCNGDPEKDVFNNPVKLYRPDRAEPIELPILAKELSLGSYIRYVGWANKYLIVPGERRDVPYGRLTNGMYGKAPYQVYLMSPNGQIETITIPEGKWLRPSDAAWPRGGLYFNGNQGTEQGEGGWLLKPNGEFKRIFDRSSPSEPSPNGCKLAVSASSRRKNFENGFIRIVDFCSKK